VTAVALLGTLDTKGDEYQFVQAQLNRLGIGTILIDTGILDDPSIKPDISADTVAAAADADLNQLRQNGNRGAAVSAMTTGATSILSDLLTDGRIDGIIGLGGTGGTTLVAAVMRTLPVGFPKLIVSTVASGDTGPYVGTSDITLMYSIVDIAGLNTISRRILANAAHAIAGMASHASAVNQGDKPVIGATMFGVTTPAITTARTELENLGYEVLVFHATGAGGAAMEGLIEAGAINGVLDLTTTELADELVGGVFSAGPNRLTVAARNGIPQVVSVGALDMVNFGPPETIPEKFADRTFHIHNATVTLMRTTAEENRELGRRIAERLGAGTGPTAVHIPRGGVSAIDIPGQPFHDVSADETLFDAITANLPEHVELVVGDEDINHPEFARRAARHLHHLITEGITNEPS
jgi:uncharacterized protein (UPF0261 family)